MKMTTDISALKDCALFKNIEEGVIKNILNDSEILSYQPSYTLIKKGSLPDGIFIINEGKVGIYNEDVLLAELGPGSIMGESFLADATATATIITVTPITVVLIKKNIFYRLSVRHPQLALNIFSITFQRLRSSNDAALREARAREETLEKLVMERTAELNDALHELRTINNELSITRDNLIETQKFRQQFLANMSHEIRTPMNAIVGLTNLLLKSPLNELQDKYLNVIKKSGSNLLVIINDILDLAKIESGKMELEQVSFPLVQSVKNIQTILGLKAEEKGIQLDAVIGDDVPEYVLGDETRITQVIMNLTGNAIKFTPKGGVTIKVEVVKKKGDESEIRFGIRDSGIGIPEDKIDTIFESFGQVSAETTRKFGGTGLGLTISKQLVEMHGGELKVNSKLGEGSEFYFTIKYKAGEKPVADDAENLGDAEMMKGKKILLVEDNEFNQMVAVDTLMDLFPHIEVDVAENGIVALDKMSSEDYSFVFMDIQMPEMDGYETARQIRKRFNGNKQNIRICAMTANVTKEEIDQCLASGMNDYMIKPFTQETLREKVLKNALVSE
jgi:signal transduction histidine kinase/CheY-like chemotaxis protein